MVLVKMELVKVTVSESSEKAANVVYKGRLEDRQWIAVKKYTEMDWPDPEQFKEEAQCVGKLRHKRPANLIGYYCCAVDERLLVAEYMPNDTPAKHLFHWEKLTIEWLLRLRVTFYIAEVLDYCNTDDLLLYHDLNAYRVLFDEDGDLRLSCFSTNHAYKPSEHLKNGRVTPENVIYSFGTVLLDLLSRKHILPIHAFDMIRGENLNLLMDSQLEGKFSFEKAAEVVALALQCLQSEARERPSTKDLVVTLDRLLTKSDVPSNVKLRISKHKEALSTPQRPLSPLAEACSRMDLTAIHQILVMANYGDDKETHECTNVNIMVSTTAYAARSLCLVFSDGSDDALLDALQTQCAQPDCPTARLSHGLLYAISCTFQIGHAEDAADMLHE